MGRGRGELRLEEIAGGQKEDSMGKGCEGSRENGGDDWVAFNMGGECTAAVHGSELSHVFETRQVYQPGI